VGAVGGVASVVVKDALSASISPDGKTLAFVRGRVGSTSLWTASPPEAEPKQYTQPPFADKLGGMTAPQFAPDGSKIAVAVARQAATTAAELWIVPFPAGAPMRVNTRLLAGQGRTQRPCWMPDGRRLVISEGGHLYMADTGSGALRRLTVSTEAEYQPAVAPDGRRIAFASGSYDVDLAEVALDGAAVRTLLATSRSEREGTWSPTGTQYAYVTDASGAWEIWLRSAQEGWARPLVQHGVALSFVNLSHPRFSPDGRRIAYDVAGARHEIAISNVAGGPPLMPDPTSPDHHGLSWSPDGNWIAYRRLNAGKWELVKRPLGAGEPVWLEEAAEGGSETEWSRSGEWIGHMRNGNSLHLVSADGARHAVISSSGTTAFGFAWDSATLYAIRHQNRRWELAAFAVAGGKEKRVMPLDLPVSANVTGFSANPDGKSFITSVSQARFDLWVLEGFDEKRRWAFR
jgi:Tol biopolymer transport system component